MSDEAKAGKSHPDTKKKRAEAARIARAMAARKKRLLFALKACLGVIIVLGFALFVLKMLVFYGVLR